MMAGTQWLWALRDLRRRPAEAVLVGVSLASLTLVLGVVLSLQVALETTTRRLIADGPPLVLRRVAPTGLAPLPVAALEAVAALPGVLAVRPRWWGVVGGVDFPVTVIGVDAQRAAELGIDTPDGDLAWGGAGLDWGDQLGQTIRLQDLRGVRLGPELQVAGVLGSELGPALHRAVLVSPAQARQLLELPAGTATDATVEVRHAATAAALQAELREALDFPVQIETRMDAAWRYSTMLARRGGLVTVALLPALFALLVLVLGAARDRLGRRAEVALLKTLGWTTQDVIMLHLRRALWVGAPAMLLGLCAAWWLVFSGAATWPARWLLGWSGSAPGLQLDADGGLLVGIKVLALVGAPWLLAVLWPGFRAAVQDPGETLGTEVGR